MSRMWKTREQNVCKGSETSGRGKKEKRIHNIITRIKCLFTGFTSGVWKKWLGAVVEPLKKALVILIYP